VLFEYLLCEWKVLIGCDGVNSVVAKWLGFNKPAFTWRSGIRGGVDLKRNHGFGNKFMQFLGKGARAGFIPCDDDTVYWFFIWTASSSQGAIYSQSQLIACLILCSEEKFS
jgi:2-polyprenyl-6-methoxyphenol hydroxylase-like FAD-dependent oxidoreductase